MTLTPSTTGKKNLSALCKSCQKHCATSKFNPNFNAEPATAGYGPSKSPQARPSHLARRRAMIFGDTEGILRDGSATPMRTARFTMNDLVCRSCGEIIDLSEFSEVKNS